jgi:hypothetical protein
MSRELPARPNLEFLKKEAKDRLPELQLRDPSAQLSDAQYQLARDWRSAWLFDPVALSRSANC